MRCRQIGMVAATLLAGASPLIARAGEGGAVTVNFEYLETGEVACEPRTEVPLRATFFDIMAKLVPSDRLDEQDRICTTRNRKGGEVTTVEIPCRGKNKVKPIQNDEKIPVLLSGSFELCQQGAALRMLHGGLHVSRRDNPNVLIYEDALGRDTYEDPGAVTMLLEHLNREWRWLASYIRLKRTYSTRRPFGEPGEYPTPIELERQHVNIELEDPDATPPFGPYKIQMEHLVAVDFGAPEHANEGASQ